MDNVENVQASITGEENLDQGQEEPKKIVAYIKFADQIEPGFLTQEQLDFLRAEMQSVSPQRKVQLDQYALECQQMLSKYYGRFMKTPRTIKSIQDRIIVVDRGTKNYFSNIWDLAEQNIQTQEIKSEISANPARAYLPEKFIMIDNLVATDYFPENVKNKLIKKYGEQIARAKMDKDFMMIVFAHEITHLYQNDRLPLWLQECGAYLYSWMILQKLDLDLQIKMSGDILGEFFKRMVWKFGPKVHRLFWGNKVDERLLNKISAEKDLWLEKSEKFRKELTLALRPK